MALFILSFFNFISHIVLCPQSFIPANMIIQSASGIPLGASFGKSTLSHKESVLCEADDKVTVDPLLPLFIAMQPVIFANLETYLFCSVIESPKNTTFLFKNLDFLSKFL